MKYSLAVFSGLALAACLSNGNVPTAVIKASSTSAKVGQVIQLDGSTSVDKNKNGLTYDWRFISVPAGSSPGFNDPHAPAATFAPDIDGTFVIGLVVTDGAASNSASVTITAADTCFKIPTTVSANQGEKATIVTVDASCASASAQFQWTLQSAPAGSKATVSSSTLDPQLVPDLSGSPYVLSYSVKYGDSDYRPAATVTVNVAGCAPLSTITTSTDIASVGEPVHLSVAPPATQAVNCGNHQLVSAQWTIISQPGNGDAQTTFVDADPSQPKSTSTAAATSLLTAVPGTYVVGVQVTDNFGAQSASQHTLTITPTIFSNGEGGPVFPSAGPSYAYDSTTDQPAVVYEVNETIFFSELDKGSNQWTQEVAVVPELTNPSAAPPVPNNPSGPLALAFLATGQPCIGFFQQISDGTGNNAISVPRLRCRTAAGWPTTSTAIVGGLTATSISTGFLRLVSGAGGIGALLQINDAGPPINPYEYVVCTSGTACGASAVAFGSVAATGIVSSGQLLVTPNGNVRIAFFDNQKISATNPSIVINKCTGATTCSSAGNAHVVDPMLVGSSFIASAGNDTDVSISYFQTNTGAFTYTDCLLSNAACGPATTPHELITNSQTIGGLTLQITDAAGNVDIAWSDKRSLDIIRAHRDASSGSWTNTPQQMDLVFQQTSPVSYYGGEPLIIVHVLAGVVFMSGALFHSNSGALVMPYFTDVFGADSTSGLNFINSFLGFDTQYPQGLRVFQRAQ